MDKEYFNILIFGHKTSKMRHLKIPQEDVSRLSFTSLAFAVLSTTFFFCDYIQVKKKAFELGIDCVRRAQAQKSQIHFFSARIEDLEKQLSKLKEFRQENSDHRQSGEGTGRHSLYGDGWTVALRYPGEIERGKRRQWTWFSR